MGISLKEMDFSFPGIAIFTGIDIRVMKRQPLKNRSVFYYTIMISF